MKKAILLSIVLAGTLFSVKPQSYPKAPGAIRLLTYNTHYCKGGYDPGEINEGNVKNLHKSSKLWMPMSSPCKNWTVPLKAVETVICCAK